MKWLSFCIVLAAAPTTAATLSSYMHDGIPGAAYIPRYSDAERQQVSGQKLSATITLTPDSPYAADGTHFEVWKPSFVVGTADGGEIGVNFWNIHNEGHIDISLPPAESGDRLADCRVVTTGRIRYAIYIAKGDRPAIEEELTPYDGHVLIHIPTIADATDLVELWPSPEDAPTGYLGCDISVVN